MASFNREKQKNDNESQLNFSETSKSDLKYVSYLLYG